MKLSTQAEIHVPRPPEDVFDMTARIDGFSQFLHALGPIPAVKGAAIAGGGEPSSGARRLVSMSDGSVMEEEILELSRPHVHRYRWTKGPKPPFSWLVRSGEGTWSFSPQDGGTRVVWTYTFELTSRIASPLAAVVIAIFRRWMLKGLAELRAVMTR
jgi:uncharacterized protein YndB with AHSA1/START domain